jgi:alpha-L-rhamnosidase
MRCSTLQPYCVVLHMVLRAVVLVPCFLVLVCAAMKADEPPQHIEWTANWIAHPTAPLREPGVFHFRKAFELSSRPTRFLVHVSADNRFILFVNGQRVGEGPARGDLMHWRYETFDLGPFLASNRNIIAATVWQFGIYAPMAQTSNRLAFLVQGDTKAEAVVNTDSSWEVEQENGHIPVRAVPEGLWSYYVAGPGERIDGTQYDWNWMQANSSAGHWVKPPMEFTEVPSGHTVRSSLPSAASFPGSPAVIPSHTDVTLLLDAGVVVSAYPQLIVTGGRGGRVQLAYTEALYDSKHNTQ